MVKFNIGDIIRIKGDWSDDTTHLDGAIGEVIIANSADVEVRIEGNKYTWWIWNYNAELVNPAKFYIGDTVSIRGDIADDSMELDGKTGKVIAILGTVIGVSVDGIDSPCWLDNDKVKIIKRD